MLYQALANIMRFGFLVLSLSLSLCVCLSHSLSLTVCLSLSDCLYHIPTLCLVQFCNYHRLDKGQCGRPCIFLHPENGDYRNPPSSLSPLISFFLFFWVFGTVEWHPKHICVVNGCCNFVILYVFCRWF